MKIATLTDKDTIEIRFTFSWETLDLVKSIPGRKFHNEKEKYWSCPATPFAVKTLSTAGFCLESKIPSPLLQLDLPLPANQKHPAPTQPAPTRPIPPLKKSLYPFQVRGVEFIEARRGRALLADEMGLGKTIQALAWLALHPELRPAIVLCPAHLKLNWVREIQQTMPGRQNVQVLFGTTPTQLTGEIVIINYDILPSWLDTLIDWAPKALIVDEAHYCKNTKAQRTKAAKTLARHAPHVVALTGTPIVNRPIEGHNIIQMIDKRLFPNFWEYVHRYCGARHNGFGWDYSGASNQEELHQKLTGTIMLRRLKADVLPDLPDKTRSYIPLELDNRAEYTAAEDDFIRFVRARKGAAAAERAKAAEYLVRIEGLKQLAVEGKIKPIIQWIEDFIDNNGKLVVFATHKFTVNALLDAFPNVAVKVDGSVPAAGRESAILAFQTDPRVKLFVGNIRAAGTGITLTAASAVAFVELPWTSGELSQAEDRLHRIGQKSAVNIYFLLANETIEERIAALLDEKRRTLSAILDGEEVKETELLTKLIQSYAETPATTHVS